MHDELPTDTNEKYQRSNLQNGTALMGKKMDGIIEKEIEVKKEKNDEMKDESKVTIWKVTITLDEMNHFRFNIRTENKNLKNSVITRNSTRAPPSGARYYDHRITYGKKLDNNLEKILYSFSKSSVIKYEVG